MKRARIHFMGIGGSGISSVAVIAKKQGFEVTGCDLEEDTPYLAKVKRSGIPVFKGHDRLHIKNADILAVTPAAFYQNKNHPELVSSNKVPVMTWQAFSGKFLQVNKRIISIAGTHGKSTTTAIVGTILEHVNLDPTVELGATVPRWHANYRIGKGKYFINEADEFYDNFLNYKPDIALINNIEYDHPDYFKSRNDVLHSFTEFIKRIKPGGKLVINLDSPQNQRILEGMKKAKAKVSVVGFTISGKTSSLVAEIFQGKILRKTKEGTLFKVSNSQRKLKFDVKIKLAGSYNVLNTLGAISVSVIEGVDPELIKQAISKFEGIERRMQLVDEKMGIKVYDDYAHHPTAIKATLEGLRQRFPDNRVICIVEPHTYLRTKKLLAEYKGVFDLADLVMVAPIFKSRDAKTYGVTNDSMVKASGHRDIEAFNSFDKIVMKSQEILSKGDVVIVMGAGKSYQLAKMLLNYVK